MSFETFGLYFSVHVREENSTVRLFCLAGEAPAVKSLRAASIVKELLSLPSRIALNQHFKDYIFSTTNIKTTANQMHSRSKEQIVQNRFFGHVSKKTLRTRHFGSKKFP